MLVTQGKISRGDFGEESLVGRFLLALVLNEYSTLNIPDSIAFRKFGQRCLELVFEADAINDGSATIEYQANRGSGKGDNTTLDAIFTIEQEWVWGIEAKYFALLEIDQIKREIEAVENLQGALNYRQAGMLFVLPEQQIGTILKHNKETRKVIADFIINSKVSISIASWEMIFEILIESGSDELRKEIVKYCKFRNENKSIYSTNILEVARIHNSSQWKEYFVRPENAPKDLPIIATVIGPPVIGKASACIEEVFFDDQVDMVKRIARMGGFELLCQQSYANLSKKKRAHAQLHPCGEDIDIVVREADEYCPKCTFLIQKEISKLNGYQQSTNRAWLEGRRNTKTQAIAFTIKVDFMKDPYHEGWKEIDALLKYAHTK